MTATLSAAIVGCSQSPAPSQFVPRADVASGRVAGASSYRVVHNFGNGTDGSSPQAGLLYANGMLYGTTASGGGGYCGFGGSYCGTVFSLTLDGAEKVLHSFGRGSDGWLVQAGLVRVNDKFYGTTANSQAYCGARNGHRIFCNGTVFSVTKTGAEKVIHQFANRPGDAASPWASLVYVNGLLYGTTTSGGLLGPMGRHSA